jgi:hypothetical protein
MNGEPDSTLDRPHTPGQVLAVLTDLRASTKAARQRAGWVPLAIIGVLLLVADRISRFDSGVRPMEVPGSGGGYRTPKDHWLANVAGYPPNVPLSVYWLISIPVAFTACALWLRWRSHRDGVAQPWLAVSLLGLLPFLALVLVRLVLEPTIPSIHAVLQHESPSKWLNPLYCVGLGLITVGIIERSRLLLTACAAIVAANVGFLVLVSNGVREGSWRDHLISAIYRPFNATGTSLLGVSGALLLLVALGWLALKRRPHSPTSQHLS